MPNHLHLLVETPAGNLSAFMAQFLTAYALYFNRRHHRVGHLTQGRYKAQLVEGNDYLLKLSRYIHLNPVCGKSWTGVSVAERREQLRNYRWSTYRSYAELAAEWSFIDYGPVRALVAQLGADYRDYVEMGLASNDEEFQALYQSAGLTLGSEEFTEGVKRAHDKASRNARWRENVAFRRKSARSSVQNTLATVAKVLETTEAELRRRRRNCTVRGAAAWALVRHAGLTEREAGEVLCMGTGAAVSQQLSNWRHAVLSDSHWQRIEAALERSLTAANF